MAFTAADVKKLREMTGCGMMDCKKALTESDGDMEKAAVYLREKGLAAVEKKAGRIAAEGLVLAVVRGEKGAIVEVNSETDFVAKNQFFRDFVELVANTVIDNAPRRCRCSACLPGGKRHHCRRAAREGPYHRREYQDPSLPVF